MNDTSKIEHTPEPWRVGDGEKPFYAWPGQILGNHTDDGTEFILASLNQNYTAEAVSNARRIVACVNACRGIETETLGKGELLGSLLGMGIRITELKTGLEVSGVEAMRQLQNIAKALRERDEARAMVKRLADALRNLDDCDDYEELISEADPLNMPKVTTCPSCYHVWPGHPTRCEACHTILTEDEPHV